jgi:excinuclease ABC subunit C
MSHLQGTDYVGSMVVFEDGLPKKSDYRRFIVQSVPSNDDYRAMEEVLTRRLRNYLSETKKPLEATSDDGASPSTIVDDIGAPVRKRPSRFSYPPDLLLVDGGKGQLGVGVAVLGRLGLTDKIDLASLAKQFEEVFRPGTSIALRLPRNSEALYLLQRVRDEAHRFAITFHKERRGKRMTKSVLDGISGLGPARMERLLAASGGLQGIRAQSRDDLRAYSWLPQEVADAVYEAVRGLQRVVTQETGEVADE